MSPLTKVFVGLLIVLALLQTAAVVVYVNKEDVQRNTLKQTQDRLSAAESRANSASEAMAAMQQNVTAIQQQANDQAARMTKDLTGAQQTIGQLNVDLAKAASTAAAQQLDISRLTEGLNTSQATTNKLQDEVARLRTTNDQLVRQASELNSTVSDLTNRLDVTEKERKFLAEQVAELQNTNTKLGGQLKSMGVQPGAVANAPVSAPPITGRVLDVKVIAGRPYATISVGSADQVAPGMEFKIVNRATGDFLGALVVDSVEPNEATGHLSGPRIKDIRPGVEARTQL